MKKGLTIKIHEHVNDDILSYISKGVTHHRDSVDFEAPLSVRQQVYILDSHPKAGEELEIPVYIGLTPFLYVMNGEITVRNPKIGKKEALTDLVNPLPPLVANEDTTIVLFLVNMNAPMSTDGTISGFKN